MHDQDIDHGSDAITPERSILVARQAFVTRASRCIRSVVTRTARMGVLRRAAGTAMLPARMITARMIVARAIAAGAMALRAVAAGACIRTTRHATLWTLTAWAIAMRTR